MVKLKESNQLPVEAKRYKDRIEKDSVQLPVKQCVKCSSRHFQKHEKRLRWFLPVVECIVYPIHCLLYRWNCVNCGTTFIHMPAMCMRFKRFLRQEVESRSQKFVETDPISYQKVVRERGSSVVYNDPMANAESTKTEKEKESVRELAPSTVHRWIGSIATHREQLQPVVKLARQVNPGTCLSSIMIQVTKYRSEARKHVLEVCGLLLRALRIVRETKPTNLAILGSSP